MAAAVSTNAEGSKKSTESGEKAIFRVKRKRCDDPVEALVVYHTVKRKKNIKDKESLEKKEDETVQVLFTLAGTVSKDDRTLAQRTLETAKSKSSFHKLVKQNPYNTASGETQRIGEKLRDQRKANIKANRFKLVSSNRSTDDNSDGSNSITENSELTEVERELFQLYDVIQEAEDSTSETSKKKESKIKNSTDPDQNVILCNNVKMVRENCSLSKGMNELSVQENEYVYDIYYTEEEMGPIGNILNVEAVEQEFLSCENIDDDEVIYEDEDDSNDESNWRNDYPDEDELSSDDEDGVHKSNKFYRYQQNAGLLHDPDEERCGPEFLSSDDDDDNPRIHLFGIKNQYSNNQEDYDSEISDREDWYD